MVTSSLLADVAWVVVLITVIVVQLIGQCNGEYDGFASSSSCRFITVAETTAGTAERFRNTRIILPTRRRRKEVEVTTTAAVAAVTPARRIDYHRRRDDGVKNGAPSLIGILRGGGATRDRSNASENSKHNIMVHPPTVYNMMDPPRVVVKNLSTSIRTRLFPILKNTKEKLVCQLNECREYIQQQQRGNNNVNNRNEEETKNKIARKEKREIEEKERGLGKSSSISVSSSSRHHQTIIQPFTVGTSALASSASATGTTSAVIIAPMKASSSSLSQRLLVPSRIIKLSLLSVLIAEGLDRSGILYEDVPAILRRQWTVLWYSDIVPAGRTIQTRIGNWYRTILRPLFLRWSVISRDEYEYYYQYCRWKVTRFCTSMKFFFASGVFCGMVSTPVLIQWTVLYWEPAVLLYGLAEINHCVKHRYGQKFVQLLGDAPQTIGAILDVMLDQCRNYIRRTLFFQRAVQQHPPHHYKNQDSFDYYNGNGRIVGGKSSRSKLPMIEGGIGSNISSSITSMKTKKKKKRKGKKNNKGNAEEYYSLGITSSSPIPSRTKLEELIEEFKELMISPSPPPPLLLLSSSSSLSLSPPSPKQRQYEHHYDYNGNIAIVEVTDHQQRRTMIKQGFIVGCSIGLAILGRIE